MGRQIICSNCLSNVDSAAPACPYCGQSFENTNPAGTLPVNTLLADRYTIGRVLSLDGEGVLYAAVDGGTTRRVVIKEYVPITICAARARDGSVIPRPGREVLFKTTRMDFIDLYRSLVALGRTTGLTPVTDLFEANNTAYAVREPDEGVALYSYLEQRGGPLTLEEAVRLMRPVVAGVDAMHRMGLLHRGVSPETIFVTSTGEARLSGYATLGLRTADSELKSQMFDGYAAPEQYAVSEFDGKYTDIYGLGAVFYRLLTGREPTPSNLRRMNDTLTPVHMAAPDVPGYASKAIMRALRIAPGERMQSAAELLSALTASEEEEDGDEGGARLTPGQTRVLILGVLVLLLVAAISIWAIVASRRSSAPESDAGNSSLTDSFSDSDTASSSGSGDSSSGSASGDSSSESEPDSFVVPSFVGKKYVDVATNQEYIRYVAFLTEHEYSIDFKEGEIIRQSHPQGTKVAIGTVITLTVSDGPETAVMPTVIGHTQAEAEAELKALRIEYTIVQIVNDGKYKEGFVARCDTEAGSIVEIARQKVMLYIEGPEPVSSSSSSDTTSIAPPPVAGEESSSGDTGDSSESNTDSAGSESGGTEPAPVEGTE